MIPVFPRLCKSLGADVTKPSSCADTQFSKRRAQRRRTAETALRKSPVLYLHKRTECDGRGKAFSKKNPNPRPIGTRFGFVCCGGDEGDRTPYLLNAIQALSQVSYTPTGLPSRDCFAIIANPVRNVNPLFRENRRFFSRLIRRCR